ncbi:MAG: hypothetical protein EA428_01205, partial [Spirochaetaceae bacterium]
MILDGEERGRAEGIEQGIDQGRIKERRETVAKMLAKGMDEQLIGEITGLSPAELAELKSKP